MCGWLLCGWPGPRMPMWLAVCAGVWLLLVMYVTGWVPVVGWLVGCLTSKLAGNVDDWFCG